MKDIIEVDNGGALFAGPSSTLSFWVWTDTTAGHGLFVMGINGFKGSYIEMNDKANSINNISAFTNGSPDPLVEPLFFNGDGKFEGNGGWQGTSFNTDLSSVGGLKGALANKWAHFVYTYDAGSKLRTLYINGSKMMQADFKLWPNGDAKQGITGQKAFTTPAPEFSNKFAFGFAKDRSATLWATLPYGNFDLTTSNHFKGQLDDVRFFDVALTGLEVSTLYNAEK